MGIDPVSVGLGAIATLVGVLTLGNTLNRQKVKLKVTPAPGWTVPDRQPCVTVEVVNLSSFPVTIDEIGIYRTDGKRYSSLDRPMTNGKPLPQRLESRQSLSVYFSAAEVDINMVAHAFARTSCGTVQEGDSPAWKQLRDKTPASAIH